MASHIPPFQIEIRFDDASSDSAEIQALANCLEKRGHSVSIKRSLPKGSFVRDIAKQARDLKDFAEKDLRGIAENVRDVAETGMQKLKDIVEPYVQSKSNDAKDEKPKSDDKITDNAFDDIGPSTAPQNSSDSNNDNRALIVTSPNALLDSSWDAMRIGLMTKTELNDTWQPSTLDAMVISHTSFRPYLEYIHWDPKRIFEGGYLALTKNCPSLSHDDAQKRFNLDRNNGPIVLVMASEFDDLQSLIIQLSLIKIPMQLFFYHAGDAYKADQLRILAQKFSVNARMFGRVDPLPNYLAMADLAVIHANDNNAQLLENAGVPTVFVLNQQTPAIATFLAHENAAAISPALIKLSNVLASIIPDNAKLDLMRQNAQNIASLANIERCADAIEAALAKKSEIAPDTKSRSVTTDGFETIGNFNNQPTEQTFITPQSSAPQAVTAPAQYAQPLPVTQPVTQTMLTPQNAPVLPQNSNPEPAPFLTPSLNARSKTEISEEYTKLTVAERSIDKSLDDISAEVRKWEQRLDLARQNNRDDLINIAQANLKTAQAQEMSLFQQKDQIQQQKSVLKQSFKLATPSLQEPRSNIAAMLDAELNSLSKEELETEKAFLEMQKNDALARLKKDMGR